VDYIRNLSPQIIPYNEDNEDENVQPGDVLNYEHKDQLSFDCLAYAERSIDHIPNCGNVDPPMKDMYAVCLICTPSCVLISESAVVWETGMAILTITMESTRYGSR
jgi:hypothetical protein